MSRDQTIDKVNQRGDSMKPKNVHISTSQRGGMPCRLRKVGQHCVSAGCALLFISGFALISSIFIGGI